jgi:hypothetical protein
MRGNAWRWVGTNRIPRPSSRYYLGVLTSRHGALNHSPIAVDLVHSQLSAGASTRKSQSRAVRTIICGVTPAPALRRELLAHVATFGFAEILTIAQQFPATRPLERVLAHFLHCFPLAQIEAAGRLLF